MSVFNSEKYIQESIESILNQSFKDFEFIIVNDACTDQTGEILTKYANNPRVKIIENKENIGLTKSLNKALKVAQGEYIARQDADDVSLPDRFQKQIDYLESNPEIKLLGTFAYGINNRGEVLREEIPPVSSKAIKKVLIKNNTFIHPSVMIRKDILDKVGLYNEDFETTQDYELWFRILKIAEGSNLPLSLVKKRYTPEMASLQKEKIQLRNTLFLQNQAIKRRDYSVFSYIHLLRPYLSLKCPSLIKNFLRNNFLKSKNVFKKI